MKITRFDTEAFRHTGMLGVNGQEVADYWQQQELSDVHKQMVGVTDVRVNIGEHENVIQTHVLSPRANDTNENVTLIHCAEHQQPYQEMQHIGAAVTRDLILPNSNVIMFQSNSFRNNVHPIDKKGSTEALRDKIAHEQVLAAKQLGVRDVVAYGYSLGALGAINFAKWAARYDIRVLSVVSDEAPSKTGRGSKELRDDFMKSGGWGEQRAAMDESGIPAVKELAKARRLGPDYVKFGIATLLKHNRLAQQSMQGSMEGAVNHALQETRGAGTTFKFGAVDQSRLFDLESIKEAVDQDPRRIKVVEYFGELCHGHATVNNPFMRAAMVMDGTEVLRKQAA